MSRQANDDIAELRSRIDQIHALLAGQDKSGHPTAVPGAGNGPPGSAPRLDLMDQLSFSIQIRRLRKSHFGTIQMIGPTWDMMLDLMLANANGRALSASDLATGAGVPLSSGLRMIASLEAAGLVKRSIDERDRRRSIVRLTDVGTQRMASYFEKVGSAIRARSHLAG